MANDKNNAPAGNETPHPEIDADECKGCGRCVAACPKKVLRIRATPNRRGVRPVEYLGDGCIGCAACFYTCPEPYTFKIHGKIRQR